jgi:hypothetical protein
MTLLWVVVIWTVLLAIIVAAGTASGRARRKARVREVESVGYIRQSRR